MPPKGYRKSMPGRLNSTMLTPSRRSSRVPASKSSNPSPQSSKSLDLSSTDPPDSSFNIRFYDSKTPSKTSSTDLRHGNGSPDTPLSRRRTFQARPSRLSTVYTPAVETPNSNKSSRRTRRSAAIETPQDHFSEDDFAETGWTLEQYLGLGYEEDMAGRTSPTNASSLGTRTSSRVRKPTERLMESQVSHLKLHKRKAALPAPHQKQAPQKVQKDNQQASIASKEIAKANSVNKGKEVQKKPELLGIEIDDEEAFHNLYLLTSEALSDEFKIKDDPDKVIADAREYWAETEAKAAQGVQGDEAKAPEADGMKNDKRVKPVKAAKPVKPAKAAKPVKSVKAAKPVKPVKAAKPAPAKITMKFKKSTPPSIDTDGWVKTGRVNDSGEEIILTPTDHSPYRSPHTYGDDALPYPPVRSRSDQQVEDDTALGFPPLMGDRNIPFDGEAQFKQEDVAEEKARVKTSSKAATKVAPKTASKTAPKSAPKTASKPSAGSSSKSGSKISAKTGPKTVSKGIPKTSAKTFTKANPTTTSKTSAKPSSSATTKPVFQRLTLKLKPATAEEIQRTSDESFDETMRKTPHKTTKKQSTIAKEKKRKAELISDEVEAEKPASKKSVHEKSAPATSNDTAGLVRAAEPSTKITFPTGRGRGVSRAAPRGAGGTRGTRGARGTRVSRGHGRGAATVTATATGNDTTAGTSTDPGSHGGRGSARAARGRGRGRVHVRVRGRGRARAV
ncbi:uncharacterized protein N7498_006606 [Penicillium cinerascens]|uniref:Uncharacterized protein n=1 Tax=Penicillium cinerascens TaxID=70096 RepID=A0A9W9MIK0_9EURO|nr:uncharacterized protein N7498_006606 [Penicillium cinerascens]KAJ5201943.1 hypothetical protein N7498_006606 [Penicillium cinerascens]